MIIIDRIISLRDVLLNVEIIKRRTALFIVRDEVWTLNSKCAVLDPDNVEDDVDEEPRFAMDNNLKYALDMQDIRGIVKNAYEQNPNCTENDLLRAFLYYYKSDAFIDFTD